MQNPSHSLPDTHNCAAIVGSHRLAFTARHIDFRDPSRVARTGHGHNPARCGSDFLLHSERNT